MLPVLKMSYAALIVERQRVEHDVGCGIELLDVSDRPVEDRERRQAQEVELDEADRLDVVLVELRKDRLRAGLHVQRAEVGELAGRDQHAARMHADVARQAFQLLGQFEELPHFLLRGLALDEQRLGLARVDDVGLAVLAACGRRLQHDELAGLERDQLGDAVDERGTACRARGRRRGPPRAPPACRTSRSATPSPRRTCS